MRISKLISTKVRRFNYIPHRFDLSEFLNGKRWVLIQVKIFGIYWMNLRTYSFYDE